MICVFLYKYIYKYNKYNVWLLFYFTEIKILFVGKPICIEKCSQWLERANKRRFQFYSMIFDKIYFNFSIKNNFECLHMFVYTRWLTNISNTLTCIQTPMYTCFTYIITLPPDMPFVLLNKWTNSNVIQ